VSDLLVLGNDKISGLAYSKLSRVVGLDVLIDKSTNTRRILKLIRNRRIQVSLVLKMFWAELLRSGSKPPRHLPSITSNKDLSGQIQLVSYEKIYLFRAGLIINDSVIRSGLKFLNVHAAKIPEYGGIGSINRAVQDGVYNQCASLHVVTTAIDQGEVLDFEPYTLSPDNSYIKNEEIAYKAAISLLLRSFLDKATFSESL
jgi:methionyl-tRNA formyltransferase